MALNVLKSLKTLWEALQHVSIFYEIQLTSPHSTHYRHTKHMLPHKYDGLIILFKYFNNF